MTLQNRVHPDGTIRADDWRGTFMGNRGGRIHDPQTKTLTRRRWVSKRWIICLLSFKERHRTVMGNSYTELFFYDEVSALSAGHRPCFECRRQAANRFLTALNQDSSNHPYYTKADTLDARLHRERCSTPKTVSGEDIQSYPDGTMFQTGNACLALFQRKLFLWKHTGYSPYIERPKTLEVLTPDTTIMALSAGYEPKWHASIISAGVSCS